MAKGDSPLGKEGKAATDRQAKSEEEGIAAALTDAEVKDLYDSYK